MSIPMMGFVVLCLWAVVAEGGYMKYKDPKQPLGVRIKDLLKRMTLEEKIGQMTQIERAVATADVMKQNFIGMLVICIWFFWKRHIYRLCYSDSPIMLPYMCQILSLNDPTHIFESLSNIVYSYVYVWLLIVLPCL